MKCLIVDDDSFGREMLRSILAEYADTIDTARDGAEALELFSQALAGGAPYDLVCLDILMPVMNGHDALKFMRGKEKEAGVRENREAVIVMTTALNSLEDIKEALWQGDCNNYLVKPVSRNDVQNLVLNYRLTNRP